MTYRFVMLGLAALCLSACWLASGCNNQQRAQSAETQKYAAMSRPQIVAAFRSHFGGKDPYAAAMPQMPSTGARPAAAHGNAPAGAPAP
jgi:hypothetical protein